MFSLSLVVIEKDFAEFLDERRHDERHISNECVNDSQTSNDAKKAAIFSCSKLTNMSLIFCYHFSSFFFFFRTIIVFVENIIVCSFSALLFGGISLCIQFLLSISFEIQFLFRLLLSSSLFQSFEQNSIAVRLVISSPFSLFVSYSIGFLRLSLHHGRAVSALPNTQAQCTVRSYNFIADTSALIFFCLLLSFYFICICLPLCKHNIFYCF